MVTNIMRYVSFVLCILWSISASAGEIVHVYGPGGPFPAMQTAAEAFDAAHPDVQVEVMAGPLPKWRDQALKNADFIYSGSENMMTDFLTAMPKLVDERSIIPAYLRPAAILVHPGNPLKIHDFKDLLKPGVSVMVVQGAGQTGLWEDIAGKNGNLESIRKLRANIIYYAPNSADALQRWTGEHTPDAWIIYNIWQIAHPKVAEIVPLGARHVLYRDMDLSLTQRGKESPAAAAFYRFVLGPQGKAIFTRFGWRD